MSEADKEQAVRLDRWLWAARFFKTRAMATDAVAGGKVHVDGARVKPSKLIRPGIKISVRRGPYEQTVVVHDVLEKRVSAKIAQTLYEETPESLEARERTRLMIKAQPTYVEDGKPTKKQRREVLRMKRGG